MRAHPGAGAADFLRNVSRVFLEGETVFRSPIGWMDACDRPLIRRLGLHLGDGERLYRAIQATVGASVIVDSSKAPFMRRRDHRLVAAPTWPLLLRYGYAGTRARA